MMDGYSVTDAASVLGVPEGRVWELLARGVLAGTPDGDSMRVFLKADAAAPRPAAREALPAGNGNGGSHGAEASAFRELLTEFRNLTERYGQALLALGEARGEVAGLRSRVEMLEARIDLRLPARLDAEPISWEAPSSRAPAPHPPAPEAPAPEPPAPAEVEAVLPAPAPVERAPRQRKARAPRAAVAGFAEALARAQDPSAADVGDVLASAEAVAEVEPEPVAFEPAALEPPAELAAELAVDEPAALPVVAEAEVGSAESAVPEPAAEPTYRPADVEPDWFADGDFSWLEAADHEAGRQPDVISVAVGPAAAPEPGPESEPIAEAESQAPAASEAVADSDIEPEPVPVAAVESLPESLPEAEPEAFASAPRIEPVEMGAGAEEAVLWLGGPRQPADEFEVAAAATRAEPGSSWPAADRGAATTEAIAPPLAMTEEELAQLARDEGWDEAEVAAIRAMISRPSTAAVELPGSVELDEAINALQAVPVAPRTDEPATRQWAKPPIGAGETSPRDDWAFEVETEPPPSRAPAPQGPLAPRRAGPDPDWLRRRRGPAASAYRRIRRIFSG